MDGETDGSLVGSLEGLSLLGMAEGLALGGTDMDGAKDGRCDGRKDGS